MKDYYNTMSCTVGTQHLQKCNKANVIIIYLVSTGLAVGAWTITGEILFIYAIAFRHQPFHCPGTDGFNSAHVYRCRRTAPDSTSEGYVNDIVRRNRGGNTLVFIYACIKRLCKYCPRNDRLDVDCNVESRQ